jgi:methionine-S-sulfoxide reductase
MMKHTIYLAGGCYWGAEKYLSNIAGVLETEVGFANGHIESPAYVQVKRGDTGHAETVRVEYDDAVIPLDKLLRLFSASLTLPALNSRARISATSTARAFIGWKRRTRPSSGRN